MWHLSQRVNVEAYADIHPLWRVGNGIENEPFPWNEGKSIWTTAHVMGGAWTCFLMYICTLLTMTSQLWEAFVSHLRKCSTRSCCTTYKSRTISATVEAVYCWATSNDIHCPDVVSDFRKDICSHQLRRHMFYIEDKNIFKRSWIRIRLLSSQFSARYSTSRHRFILSCGN